MRTWTDLHIFINGETEIVDYVSFIWTDKYNEPGDFELELPYTDINANLFHIDDMLTCNLSSHTMVVEDIIVSIAPETGKRMKVKGRSVESLLDRRVIADTFVIKNDSYTINKFVRAITDAYYFATRNSARLLHKNNKYEPKKDVALSGRELPITLKFDEINGHNPDIDSMNHIYGANVQIDGTGKDLLSILTENCQLMGFGFKLIGKRKHADIYRAPLDEFGREGYDNAATIYPMFSETPYSISEYYNSSDSYKYAGNAYTLYGKNQLTIYSNVFSPTDSYLIGSNSLYTKNSSTSQEDWEITRLYFAHIDHYEFGDEINFWCQKGYDENDEVVQTVVTEKLVNGPTIYYIWRKTLNNIPYKKSYVDPETDAYEVTDVIKTNRLWCCIATYIGDELSVIPYTFVDKMGRTFQTLNLFEEDIEIIGDDYDLYLYDGKDLSNEIEYSEENNNLASFEYELDSTNYKNYAFVQGDEYEDSTDYVYIGGVAYETTQFEDKHFVDGATYKNETGSPIPVYTVPNEYMYNPVDYILEDESVTLIGPTKGDFAKISSDNTENGPRWVKYTLLTKDVKTYKIFTSSYDKDIDDSDSEYYKVGTSLEYHNGLDRREVYLDSGLDKGKNSNTKYAERLNKYGIYSLANDYKLDEESSCEIVHNIEAMYEDAYNLGDIVNVKIDPIKINFDTVISSIKMRIMSYTITHTESGLDLYPSLELYDANAYTKANNSIEGFIADGTSDDFDSSLEKEIRFYARGGNDGTSSNNADGSINEPYGHWEDEQILSMLNDPEWTPLIWGAGNEVINFNDYKPASTQPVYYSMDKENEVPNLYASALQIVSTIDTKVNNTTGLVWAKCAKKGKYTGWYDDEGEFQYYWILVKEPGYEYFELLNNQQDKYSAFANEVWGVTGHQRVGDYLQVPPNEPRVDSHHTFIGWYRAYENRTGNIIRIASSQKCDIYDEKLNASESWEQVGDIDTYIAVYERLKYKVTFHPGDHGKFLSSAYVNQDSVTILVSYGDTIKYSDIPLLQPVNTVDKEYKELHWDPEEEINLPIEEDKEFTMLWTEADVTYKATFQINYIYGYLKGPSPKQLSTTKNVPYNQTPTPPEVVCNPGYTFTGWSPELHPVVKNCRFNARCINESKGEGESQDPGNPNGEDLPDSHGNHKPPTQDEDTGVASPVINDNMTYGEEEAGINANKEVSIELPMVKFRNPIYKKKDTVKEIKIWDYALPFHNQYLDIDSTKEYGSIGPVWAFPLLERYVQLVDNGNNEYGKTSEPFPGSGVNSDYLRNVGDIFYSPSQTVDPFEEYGYEGGSPGYRYSVGPMAENVKIIVKGKDDSAIEHHFEKDLPAPTDPETGEKLNDYCDLYLQAHWISLYNLPAIVHNDKLSAFNGYGSTWKNGETLTFSDHKKYLPGGTEIEPGINLKNTSYLLSSNYESPTYINRLEYNTFMFGYAEPCFGIALRRKNDNKIIALLSFEYFSYDGVAEVAFTYNPVYMPYRKWARIPPEDQAYDKFIPGLYYLYTGGTYKRLWVPPSDWTSTKSNCFYRKQVGWYLGFCTQIYDDLGNLIDASWERKAETYTASNFINRRKRAPQDSKWEIYSQKPAYEQLYLEPSHYIYNNMKHDSPFIRHAYNSSGWIFVPVYYEALKGEVSDDVYCEMQSGGYDQNKSANSYWASLHASEAHTFKPGTDTDIYGNYYALESYEADASYIYGPIDENYPGINKISYFSYFPCGGSEIAAPILYSGDGKSNRTAEKDEGWEYSSNLDVLEEMNLIENSPWSFSNGVENDDVPISKFSTELYHYKDTWGSVSSDWEYDPYNNIIKDIFEISATSLTSAGRNVYLQAFELPATFTSNIVTGIKHLWQYSSKPDDFDDNYFVKAGVIDEVYRHATNFSTETQYYKFDRKEPSQEDISAWRTKYKDYYVYVPGSDTYVQASSTYSSGTYYYKKTTVDKESFWSDIADTNKQSIKLKYETDGSYSYGDLSFPANTGFRDKLEIEDNNGVLIHTVISNSMGIETIGIASNMHEGDPDNPEEISVVGGLPDWFPNE